MTRKLISMVFGTVAVSFGGSEAAAQICSTGGVSSSPTLQANAESDSGIISRDGKWMLFTTSATNLVDDSNTFTDVLLCERDTGELTWANRPFGAVTSDNHVFAGSISPDGRWSCMDSQATNLVPGDTNGRWDVFVFDRISGVITLESRTSSGGLGDLNSSEGCVSDDGLLLAFTSEATNLVAGDTNGVRDLFIKDRVFGTVTRESIGMGGVESNGRSFKPILSSDSRYVAFLSEASNLVPGDTPGSKNMFVRDRTLGTTIVVDVGLNGAVSTYLAQDPAFSANGRFVAFVSRNPSLVVGDTNNLEDVFVRDLVTSTTTRENVDPLGGQVTNSALGPSLSADGRYLLFTSDSATLVPGDTNGRSDVFLRDRSTSTTKLFSVNDSGFQGNDTSSTVGSALSGDGQVGVFQSVATNLTGPDTNGARDTFVRACESGVTIYCAAKLNSLGCLPIIAATGFSSASATFGFVITASQVRNAKAGLLLYSTANSNNVPFQGGTLCVASPIRRSTGVSSGGSALPAQDCSGVYTLDMNAFASGALGGSPAPELLVVGTPVWCQWWGRDPGFPFPLNTSLSDGLSYTVLQ